MHRHTFLEAPAGVRSVCHWIEYKVRACLNWNLCGSITYLGCDDAQALFSGVDIDSQHKMLLHHQGECSMGTHHFIRALYFWFMGNEHCAGREVWLAVAHSETEKGDAG